MNDFAVYYQIYDNKTLTENVLNTFRSTYPDVHIRLLCDKGSDHKVLATKTNCEYVYSDYHMGLWGWNHKDVISGKHCYGWNKEEALEHINRWYNFAKSTNTKYMLMMEDDIYVTDKITIITNEFDFTQVIPGNKLSDSTKLICNRFNKNHSVDRYGCCGGHFLNRELYIECYNQCYSFIRDTYEELSSTEVHLGWPDTLNNLIYNLCGRIGSINEDYDEGFENKFKKPIFHSHVGRKEKWENFYNFVSK